MPGPGLQAAWAPGAGVPGRHCAGKGGSGGGRGAGAVGFGPQGGQGGAAAQEAGLHPDRRQAGGAGKVGAQRREAGAGGCRLSGWGLQDPQGQLDRRRPRAEPLLLEPAPGRWALRLEPAEAGLATSSRGGRGSVRPIPPACPQGPELAGKGPAGARGHRGRARRPFSARGPSPGGQVARPRQRHRRGFGLRGPCSAPTLSLEPKPHFLSAPPRAPRPTPPWSLASRPPRVTRLLGRHGAPSLGL